MVNINSDGTETHLSEDQLRHPIIQLIFFGVFWPLLWILWWVNWWRNRQVLVHFYNYIGNSLDLCSIGSIASLASYSKFPCVDRASVLLTQW
jgi:hypothetical protein